METTTAYRKDFIDNQVTSFDMVRTPAKKPVDHLKPEGDIEFTDKKPYKPAEKVIATKPQDNLFLSGEFNGKFYYLSNPLFLFCSHFVFFCTTWERE